MVVPFGGAEHDWAALELGAWIASATSAPLKMLGAAGDTDERTHLTRLLGDAGLLLPQYAAVSAEPMWPGRLAGRANRLELAGLQGLTYRRAS